MTEFDLIPAPEASGTSHRPASTGQLDNSLLKRLVNVLEFMTAPRKIYHGKFICAISNEEFPFKYDMLFFKRITFVTASANAGYAYIGGHSVDVSNSPALTGDCTVTFKYVNSSDLSVIMSTVGDIVYWTGEA